MSLYKARLLLVDDEPLVLDMFETILKTSGYDVFTAKNSHEAINLLKSNEFEVLVTDVLLEDLDGFEIHSRAKRIYPLISTILITGAPNPIDSQRASSMGIPYLSKPVGFENLTSTIESCLEENWPQLKKKNAA